MVRAKFLSESQLVEGGDGFEPIIYEYKSMVREIDNKVLRSGVEYYGHMMPLSILAEESDQG